MARKNPRRAYGTGRTSRQRERILRVIEAIERAFTADELVTALSRTTDPPGKATVYRALAALEESGYVARVGERAGAAMFTYCDGVGHHHHLVCVACGRVTPSACPIDADALEGAAREGFVITHHEITLYGICRNCLATGWSKEVH